MSALANKRALEHMAGIALDSSGMSGADLEQAALLNQTNSPSLQAGMDGARADQMDWRGAKDDFTGPNALVVGRYTKNGGRVWIAGGTTSGFNVTSNALVYDGVANGQVGIDTGLMDNFAVRCKVSAITANGPRFILRGTISTGNFIHVLRDQTANTWTFKENSGNTTLSTLNDSVDIVANDVVEFQVRGDNVTVLVNGVSRGVLTGASLNYTTNTQQGFMGVAGSGFTTDDFYAYPLAN